jgi:hypothetical protein
MWIAKIVWGSESFDGKHCTSVPLRSVLTLSISSSAISGSIPDSEVRVKRIAVSGVKLNGRWFFIPEYGTFLVRGCVLLLWGRAIAHSRRWLWFTVHTRLSCFPGQTDTTPEEDTDKIVVSEPVVYSESGWYQNLNTYSYLKYHLIVYDNNYTELMMVYSR